MLKVGDRVYQTAWWSRDPGYSLGTVVAIEPAGRYDGGEAIWITIDAPDGTATWATGTVNRDGRFGTPKEKLFPVIECPGCFKEFYSPDDYLCKRCRDEG
jgi:hypothetical protein